MAVDTYFIIGVVESAVQPITIIANLLIIVAFLKVQNLQTHTSNMLIFALSVVDLTSGMYQFLYIGVPYALRLNPPLAESGCMIAVVLEYVYFTGNILLVAISIDRVLLVSMDYSRYVKTVTKLRLKVTIGICCLIGQLGSVFELSLWNYAKRTNEIAANINFVEVCFWPARRLQWFGIYVSVCQYCLPLLLVGVFSIIFVKRLLIRINKNTRVGPEASRTNSNGGSAGENQTEASATSDTNHGTVKKRYIKSAVTLAALVSAMGISMLPYCIYLIVISLTGSFNSTLTFSMYLVLQLNPLLDPLFFAATQRGIREYYGNKIRTLIRISANRCCNTN